MPKVKPLEERFWGKITLIPFHDCWEWIGYKDRNGYGYMMTGYIFNSTRQKMGVHRISWIIHNGPIPNGLFVCHKCDNPGCVRPDHLFLGTIQDNLADMVKKGRNHKGPHLSKIAKERKRNKLGLFVPH